MDMTALALLLRILVNPLANVFQKQICARGQSAAMVNFLTYLLLALFVLPWCCSISWSDYPAAFWLSAMMVGFCGGLGNGFLVQAVRSGELSVLGPINAYKSVVGMLFGLFLLGEIPGLLGCVGILCIVIGSYYVLDTMPERFSWKVLRRKEFRYRIAAMILSAIEAVFIKKVILFSDPAIAFVIWCWSGAICSLPLMLFFNKQPWKPQIVLAASQTFPYLALAGCIGVMQYTTSYVFDHIPVGYALALFQLSAMISVVFGYCFFGETSIAKKLLGAAVMILGSVMIILQAGIVH